MISTVNIQHLESLNDVVEKITGVPQRERVPDAVVRAADQVELVDMAPEALRRRMAHGNVYAADKVDAALGNYFRVGNLTALRELALLWTADKVDEALQGYRAEHGIEGTWETRERVVVARHRRPRGRDPDPAGGPDRGPVRRRRPAGRARHPLRRAHRRQPGRARRRSGSWSRRSAAPTTRSSATTSPTRCSSSPAPRTPPSSCSAAAAAPGSRRCSPARASAPTHDPRLRRHRRPPGHPRPDRARAAACPGSGAASPLRRRLQGVALAVLLPPLLTLVLVQRRSDLNLVSDVLLFLLVVVVVALVGGFLPAMLAAVGGSLLLNYYFAPPLHTFTIRETNNALAIGVFIVVAALVSSVVDLAARRTRQAARATAEAETLGTLAGSVLRGETALPALLERVREAFGLTSVTLLERTPRPAAAAAPPPAARPTSGPSSPARAPSRAERPQDADTEVPAGDTLMLALRGRPLRAEDQRRRRRVRRAGRRHPGTAPAQRGRRRRGPDRRGRPDAHRAARRGRPRPAHPAGVGQGRRDQPAQRRHRVVRRRTTPSCCSPPTSPSTGSPGWSTTCWT